MLFYRRYLLHGWICRLRGAHSGMDRWWKLVETQLSSKELSRNQNRSTLEHPKHAGGKVARPFLPTGHPLRPRLPWRCRNRRCVYRSKINKETATVALSLDPRRLDEPARSFVVRRLSPLPCHVRDVGILPNHQRVQKPLRRLHEPTSIADRIDHPVHNLEKSNGSFERCRRNA